MKISREVLENEVTSAYCLKLPDYVDSAYMRCLLNGEDEVEVPDTFFRDITESQRVYAEENAESEKRKADEVEVSNHRLAGMEKEKNADNEGAMSEYAIAIVLGEQSRFNLFHAYAHAYERLIVCLHKAKRYNKEISYLERYLNHDLSESVRSKYSSRLEKLKSKIQK